MTNPLVTELETLASAAVAAIPGWGGPVLQFVLAELPQLLQQVEQGQEGKALQQLVELYEARRTDTMADRRAEIAQNEAEVDAALQARVAAESTTGQLPVK